MLCLLLDAVTPALEETGDTREVSSLVHRLLQQGTPPTSSAGCSLKAVRRR